MTTKDEALSMARDALKQAVRGYEAMGWRTEQLDAAIAAISEAQVQPAGYAAAGHPAYTPQEFWEAWANKPTPTPELPPLPERPEPDGFITIRLIGREVEVNAYRDSTMEEFAKAYARAALAQHSAEPPRQETLALHDAARAGLEALEAGDPTDPHSKESKAIATLRAALSTHQKEQK